MKGMEMNKTNSPDAAIPAGWVLVRLRHAALNHLDLWNRKANVPTKVIEGSDGSGIVEAAGAGYAAHWIGKEVVINPGLDWGPEEHVFGPQFRILGTDLDGTFARHVLVPQENIFDKPAHLSSREAAALPMAAVTAYRALFTKAALRAKDKVLVTGIGGGAALFLLQMAHAAGASVYVTSSSEEKIKQACNLGAAGGFNYRSADWVEKAKEAAGGFDVIVDSAGGKGFAALTEVARPGARIVLFGKTAGAIDNLQPGIIYNKQLQIMGSVMGSPLDFTGMLRFYEAHQLRPVLDREFSLAAIEDALQYMEKGAHFGKITMAID
jgi:zinc-binding alcohol dehydrogenase/oxidoreductase